MVKVAALDDIIQSTQSTQSTSVFGQLCLGAEQKSSRTHGPGFVWASCGACVRACPNVCFTDSRFIIDATKCLTFINKGAEAKLGRNLRALVAAQKVGHQPSSLRLE
jgi:hypothetical protein